MTERGEELADGWLVTGLGLATGLAEVLGAALAEGLATGCGAALGTAVGAALGWAVGAAPGFWVSGFFSVGAGVGVA